MAQDEEMAQRIGKLIEGKAERDAIHIAVAPVVATEILKPSQPIGFVFGKGDEKHVGIVEHPIGIVDPFLTKDVQIDKPFWMWLYPLSVTGMRHSWAHPAFTNPCLMIASPEPKKLLDANYAISREWLENFAAESGDMTFEELLVAAENWVATGDYIIEGGRWESCYVPDEFWPHFENVTGQKVKEKDRDSFFSCSC